MAVQVDSIRTFLEGKVGKDDIPAKYVFWYTKNGQAFAYKNDDKIVERWAVYIGGSRRANREWRERWEKWLGKESKCT